MPSQTSSQHSYRYKPFPSLNSTQEQDCKTVDPRHSYNVRITLINATCAGPPKLSRLKQRLRHIRRSCTYTFASKAMATTFPAKLYRSLLYKTLCRVMTPIGPVFTHDGVLTDSESHPFRGARHHACCRHSRCVCS